MSRGRGLFFQIFFWRAVTSVCPTPVDGYANAFTVRRFRVCNFRRCVSWYAQDAFRGIPPLCVSRGIPVMRFAVTPRSYSEPADGGRTLVAHLIFVFSVSHVAAPCM